MSKKVGWLIALVALAATGCAQVSPPPPANLGAFGLPAKAGTTTLGMTFGGGGAVPGGGGGALELTLSRQVSEKLGVSMEAVGARETTDKESADDEFGSLDSDESYVGAGGTLGAGRVALRYTVLETDTGFIALVPGAGGGYYSEGELTYVTSDVGLMATGRVIEQVSAFGGVFGAMSLPVAQSGLREENGDLFEYVSSFYIGVNAGGALHLNEVWTMYGELMTWNQIGGGRQFAQIMGASVGLSAQF